MKSIERRLAAIERQMTPPAPTILEIVIRGGLTPGVAPIASFGSNRWEAAPDELFEAFRARAVAAARAAGERSLIFGGLP